MRSESVDNNKEFKVSLPPASFAPHPEYHQAHLYQLGLPMTIKHNMSQSQQIEHLQKFLQCQK